MKRVRKSATLGYDAKSLRLARRRAEETLSNRVSKIDYARAQAELAEAIAQLAAISKLRQKR